MSEFVVVGSGINSLVCAALLARAGQKVTVLERNARPGGCIRTEELFTGYRHDILSGWYPLFTSSPAYEALGDDPHERGLELVNTDTPTGVLTDDGRDLVLTNDDTVNVARLNALRPGEGDRYQTVMKEFLSRDSELAGEGLRGRPQCFPRPLRHSSCLAIRSASALARLWSSCHRHRLAWWWSPPATYTRRALFPSFSVSLQSGRTRPFCHLTLVDKG